MYYNTQLHITGWWFQPIWKILVKTGIFPSRDENLKKWNHHLDTDTQLHISLWILKLFPVYLALFQFHPFEREITPWNPGILPVFEAPSIARSHPSSRPHWFNDIFNVIKRVHTRWSKWAKKLCFIASILECIKLSILRFLLVCWKNEHICKWEVNISSTMYENLAKISSRINCRGAGASLGLANHIISDTQIIHTEGWLVPCGRLVWYQYLASWQITQLPSFNHSYYHLPSQCQIQPLHCGQVISIPQADQSGIQLQVHQQNSRFSFWVLLTLPPRIMEMENGVLEDVFRDIYIYSL